MTGNVWEWIKDWTEAKYYLDSPQNNPKGPANGETKGIAWSNRPENVRLSFRMGRDPLMREIIIGFLLVLPVE